MLNSKFFSVDSPDIDVEDRKYVRGEAGIAESCDTFCMAMGRGHVHVIPCQRDKCQSDLHDGHRHAKVPLSHRISDWLSIGERRSLPLCAIYVLAQKPQL